MKLITLLHDLTRKPLALMPCYFDTFLNAVKENITLDIDPKMLDDGGSIYKEVGNTAVITINGVLLPKASKLEKMLGAASYADIRKAVRQAESSNVSNVIFNIDSPGGVVSGVSETALSIQKLSNSKDTYSFTNGNMCSAAYWLGAQAGNIIVSPSAMVGSIGVFVAWLSYGRALENEGIQANIFQAGKLKTLGLPAKDPTEEEKEYVQAAVEKSYTAFLGAVGHRQLDESVVQGQTFDGTEASNNGLVDGLQADIEELIAYLNT
jgi:signal peptide peptidase SppA